MAENHDMQDQNQHDGPSASTPKLTEENLVMGRNDQPHDTAPTRPHFLKTPTDSPSYVTAQSETEEAGQVADGLVIPVARPDQEVAANRAADFEAPEYLPPKLRQRMQTLMAELSALEDDEQTLAEIQPSESRDESLSIGEGADEETDEEVAAVVSVAAEDAIDAQDAQDANVGVDQSEADSLLGVTLQPEEAPLVEPAPGDLIELFDDEEEEIEFTLDEPWEVIDSEQLAKLGIETAPIFGEVSEIEVAQAIHSTRDQEEAIGAEEAAADEPSITLTTARFLDPQTMVDDQTEVSNDLVETTTTFSEQAGEIVRILSRRQAELSKHREQLELKKARTENELRRQRLELIEKKRELLEEVQQLRKQQKLAAVAGTEPSANTTQPEPDLPSAGAGRRVTLEAISMPGEKRTTAERKPAASPALAEADPQHLDQDFLNALEQHVRQHQTPEPLADIVGNELEDSPIVSHSIEESRLQRQAKDLKKQHSAAIGSLQKTRRQLELLRNVIVEQQKQTSQRAVVLDQQHREWNETRDHQRQELELDRKEQERLLAIRENELSKRETAAQQREKAARQLEAQLQQAQVEILRDRVIIRQLERTARQTLSNSQWNERLAIISEETESYLKDVQQKVNDLKSDAASQIKRADSRRSELLLYRESTRNWVQRQMKLISRRAAHLEERESQLNDRWQLISEAREDLRQQQRSLDALLQGGLRNIDQQLEQTETGLTDAA